jgi:hypothetical protein
LYCALASITGWISAGSSVSPNCTRCIAAIVSSGIFDLSARIAEDAARLRFAQRADSRNAPMKACAASGCASSQAVLAKWLVIISDLAIVS